MLRSLGKIFGLTFLLLVAAPAWCITTHVTTASRKIEKLQDEKRQLEQVVDAPRARTASPTSSSATRKATPTACCRPRCSSSSTTRTATPLPAKSFTIEGNTAHIDAMVIKFDHDYVAENDALRGHSIALFTKIYGDNQSPADAAMIDSPGKIPTSTAAPTRSSASSRLTLWNDFWKLYEDETYRKSQRRPRPRRARRSGARSSRTSSTPSPSNPTAA